MSVSLLTNKSSMTALQTLRGVSMQLSTTQDRISTGLKVSTGKDNASYFSISSTMRADIGAFKAISENLTLTKNAVTIGRVAAQSIAEVTKTAIERVAFSLGSGVDLAKIQQEITDLAGQAATAMTQATFNGEQMVTDAATVTVTTGLNRVSGVSITATNFTFTKVNLSSVVAYLGAIGINSANASVGVRTQVLQELQTWLNRANDGATSLGLVEKRIEGQQEFIKQLTDQLQVGVGALVDADLSEESSRLQAQQVQQQLSVQALSIANQQPRVLLSLFQ